MAVFEDLNPAYKRIEDPEARHAEEIKRAGQGIDVKKKSSGVTMKAYRSSSRIIGLIVGLGSGVAILGLAVYGIYLFVNG